MEIIRGVQKKKVVCILDEAHLLEKETIEEFRFLLNYRFDSISPMALVLVDRRNYGINSGCSGMLLSVRGSISTVSFPIWIVPKPNGTSSPHLAYAGGRQDIFTDKALDDIYKESTGIPRRINPDLL